MKNKCQKNNYNKFIILFIVININMIINKNMVHGRYEDPGRGWGKKPNITWYKGIDSGLEQARLQQKPFLMLVHTKSDSCYACTKLGYEFNCAEIWELSKRFVMINVLNDEEPDEDEGFAPDGIYHPRILFGGTNGKVEATLHHKDEIYITDVEGDSREFYPDPVRMKYYYPDKASMINGMRRAMKFYGLR